MSQSCLVLPGNLTDLCCSKKTVGDLSYTLKTVGEPCTKILTSLNETSKKNQIFETINREFKGIASDIETTIMFASAGTLTPEDDSDFKGEYLIE